MVLADKHSVPEINLVDINGSQHHMYEEDNEEKEIDEETLMMQALEAGTVYPILDKPFYGSKCWGGKND